MMKLFSLFRHIDELVFRLINDWLASPVHQKVADYFNTLDLNAQKILNRVLTIGFLLFPFIVVLLLINTNAKLKDHLSQRENIIGLISKFNGSMQEYNLTSRTVVSPKSVEDRSQFIGQLNSVMGANQIKVSSVTVLEFDTNKIGGDLNESKAKISFKGFTNQEFSKFFTGIMKQQKMKIEKIVITKDKLTELLNGEVNINHYSASTKTE